MRKLMVVASMLAMVLVAAAPALAATAIGGDVDVVDSDQIQAALTIQRNSGNDQDLSGVAQDLSVDQTQVGAGSGTIAAGGDFDLDGTDDLFDVDDDNDGILDDFDIF
jgi:hypothetical protein